MMQLLTEACKDRRLRASSSLSVYAPPVAYVIDGRTLYLAAGRAQCFISEKGVLFDPGIGAVVVNGCTFSDTGVWLSITSGDFWLEIHVPPLTNRQVQTRAQRP
jgi:hypothetical protein